MPRKLIAGLLAFCAAQFIAGCVNPSVVAYSRGRMYESSRRYKEAIEEYTSAIHYEPNHATAYLYRGYCYSKLKNFDDAVKDLTKCIEIEPKNSDAYYYRAWCTSQSPWKYAEAINDYNKAIELNPKKSDAYFQRGYCRYYSSGSVDLALADYDKAIALDPKDADNYYYRSLVHRDQQNYPAMYRDLLTTTAKKPHFGDGYAQLAWAAYFNKRFNEVHPCAEDALAVKHWKSSDSPIMVLLSNITLRKLGKSEEARMVLTKGLSRCKKVWPYPLLEYFDGKIDERAVIRMAGADEFKLTQAHTYIGMDKLLRGKQAEGRDDLQYVVDEYDRYTVEYMLANLEVNPPKAKVRGKHS